jgi:hypothetical protein
MNRVESNRWIDMITGAAREYWQAARWYLTVALLSKMLRQMLQPRTLKTRAHSTLGNGPEGRWRRRTRSVVRIEFSCM